uniref:Uncharacterized protein n=1 Tax=Triticum urartu TaxID=4572 RepID=A0A8R7UNY4_TRIUA
MHLPLTCVGDSAASLPFFPSFASSHSRPRRLLAFSSASPLPLARILCITVEPKLVVLARSSWSLTSAGTAALFCSTTAATDAGTPRRHRPARRSVVLDAAIPNAAGAPSLLRVPRHLLLGRPRSRAPHARPARCTVAKNCSLPRE